MVKPLSLYLDFNFLKLDIVSDFPLLLHAWTDLKSIFFDSVCSKGLPFKNKNPWLVPHSDFVCPWEWVRISFRCSCGALESFWWPCLVWLLLGGNIWFMLCWFCLWLLGSSLFDFFMASFRVCVYVNPASFWSVLALSPPLIYHMWKHDLLLSTVLIKM